MFEKTEIKIIGLVDNMSFLGVMTEKIIKFLVKVELKKQQKNLIKIFLGHLPLHQDLRNSADKGEPLTLTDQNHEVSKLFKKLLRKLDKLILKSERVH